MEAKIDNSTNEENSTEHFKYYIFECDGNYNKLIAKGNDYDKVKEIADKSGKDYIWHIASDKNSFWL